MPDDLTCQPVKEACTLFKNVNIFDGKSEAIQEGRMCVLVKGNKIARIAASIDVSNEDGVTVIDGQGRTLMPGLVAMHEHLMLQMSYSEGLSNDSRYLAYVATTTVKIYLMNGFTSVRDAAGNSYSLNKAIQQGYVVGPRIFPSGPLISQTAGHGDQRVAANPSCFCDLNSHDNLFKMGDMIVADGVPEVLKAARENLRLGSTQIKIAVGGGTGTQSDPLEVIEYTAEEIRAAVNVAEDFQTYVMAHVYNPKGIRRAIENGVKSIEHGNLIDESTLQLMKEKGVWLSPQVSVYTFIPHGYTEAQAAKHRQAYAGLDNMFKSAKKIGFENIVFGSDVITDMAMIRRIPEEFEHRAKWFTPAEVLKQATYNGGELLQLSKRYNPGRVGLIEEGALADILLVDGNPLEDISLMTKPHEKFLIIMKDGHIVKQEGI